MKTGLQPSWGTAAALCAMVSAVMSLTVLDSRDSRSSRCVNSSTHPESKTPLREDEAISDGRANGPLSRGDFSADKSMGPGSTEIDIPSSYRALAGGTDVGRLLLARQTWAAEKTLLEYLARADMSEVAATQGRDDDVDVAQLHEALSRYLTLAARLRAGFLTENFPGDRR